MKWKGVRNVTDPKSKDNWASIVGWYVAELMNGGEQSFALLSDALKAYDVAIIHAKGKETKESEINLPEDWGSLFPNANARGAGPVRSFNGVWFEKSKSKYRSLIRHNKESVHISYFTLRTDAAFAFDEVARALKTGSKCNFSSKVDYEKARSRECQERGIASGNAEILKLIELKVKECVSKRGEVAETSRDNDDTKHSKEKCASKPKFNSCQSGSSDVKKHQQKKDFVSRYKGVRLRDDTSKYTAKLGHNCSTLSLGCYELAADAALAYDEAAKAIKDEDWELNFATKQSYCEARAKELDARGLDINCAEVLLAIESKVEDITAAVSIVEAPVSIYSDYFGVNYSQSRSKYESQIVHNDKRYNLGVYTLAADAALAHDKAVELMEGSNPVVNFVTNQDYNIARRKESKKSRVFVNHSEMMTYLMTKVDQAVSKLKPTGGVSSCTMKLSIRNNSSADDHVRSPFKQPKLKRDVFQHSFMGLRQTKKNAKHESRICHNSNRHSLGCYHLATDAAYAYDQAAAILKQSDWDTNFATLDQYEESRAKELKVTGCDVDRDVVMAFIPTKVKEIESKAKREGIALASSPTRDCKRKRDESIPRESQPEQTNVSYDKGVCSHKMPSPKVDKVVSTFQAALPPSFTQQVSPKSQRLASDKLTNDATSDNTADPLAQIMPKGGEAAAIVTVPPNQATNHKRKDEETECQDNPKKAIAAAYLGVTYMGRNGRCRAQIRHKKRHYLGQYQLATDAAYAYDRVAFILKGPSWTVNFASRQEYENARANELERIQIELKESLSAIEAKVQAAVSEARKFVSSVLREKGVAENVKGINSAAAIDSHTRNTTNGMPTSSVPTDTTLATGHDGCAAQNETIDGTASFVPKEKIQSSSYKGVSYDRRTSKFRSRITVVKKGRRIGEFRLEADAAEGATVNFSTKEEYKAARAREIEERGINAKSAGLWSEVALKIKRCVMRIREEEKKESAADTPTEVMDDVGVRDKGAVQLNPSTKGVGEGSSAVGVSVQQFNATRVPLGNVPDPLNTEISLADAQEMPHSVIPEGDSAAFPEVIESMDPPAHCESKMMYPRFAGVTYNNVSSMYDAAIEHDAMTDSLGSYHLASDAAYAYDEGSKAIPGSSAVATNFACIEEYESARANEIKASGFSLETVGTLAEVKEHIESFVISPLKAIDLIDYSDSEEVAVANNERPTQNSDTLASPVDTNAFTSAPAMKEVVGMDVSKLIRFEPDQTVLLAFPFGCPVLVVHADGQTYQREVVEAVYYDNASRQILYEMKPNNETAAKTPVVPQSQVAFDVNCPVFVDDSTKGIVLVAKRTSSHGSSIFSYTVMINCDEEHFGLVANISSERVKFRHTASTEEEATVNRKPLA